MAERSPPRLPAEPSPAEPTSVRRLVGLNAGPTVPNLRIQVQRMRQDMRCTDRRLSGPGFDQRVLVARAGGGGGCNRTTRPAPITGTTLLAAVAGVGAINGPAGQYTDDRAGIFATGMNVSNGDACLRRRLRGLNTGDQPGLRERRGGAATPADRRICGERHHGDGMRINHAVLRWDRSPRASSPPVRALNLDARPDLCGRPRDRGHQQHAWSVAGVASRFTPLTSCALTATSR